MKNCKERERESEKESLRPENSHGEPHQLTKTKTTHTNIYIGKSQMISLHFLVLEIGNKKKQCRKLRSSILIQMHSYILCYLAYYLQK